MKQIKQSMPPFLTVRKFMSLLIVLLVGCDQQPAFNTEELASELDSIMVVDQRHRAEMQAVHQEFGWDSPEMTEIWERQSELDESDPGNHRSGRWIPGQVTSRHCCEQSDLLCFTTCTRQYTRAELRTDRQSCCRKRT